MGVRSLMHVKLGVLQINSLIAVDELPRQKPLRCTLPFFFFWSEMFRTWRKRDPKIYSSIHFLFN